MTRATISASEVGDFGSNFLDYTFILDAHFHINYFPPLIFEHPTWWRFFFLLSPFVPKAYYLAIWVLHGTSTWEWSWFWLGFGHLDPTCGGGLSYIGI